MWFSIGNENARTEARTTSLTVVPKKIFGLNSLQNSPLAASVSTQAVKATKIPRCQALSVHPKSQSFVKGSSEPQNKAYKRKLPEKVGEELDPNFSRRKTFIVKDHILTVTSYTKISPGENELSEGTSNTPLDRLISKSDKRQTFVIKAKNASEETEPATNLNNTINKELITESRVNGDETRHAEEDFLKNKRKTFVKLPLQQNDVLEYQVRISSGPSLSVNSVSAETENGKESENLESSPNLQRNRETDHAMVKRKSISVENSKEIEHTAGFTSPKANKISGSSSKEMLSETNATNKTGEIENLQSKIDDFISANITAKVADVKTRKSTSCSSVDENISKIGEISPGKTCKLFLESSESDCEVMMIEEMVDFSGVKPALQTTPIRRQISKNKKRKFVFDGKKRKTIVKKKSQCEIINSETGENGSQKSAVVCQSSSGAICNNDNDVNKINEADATHVVSEEILNRDNLNNIPSGAVKKKTTKNSRKNKGDQITPTKNNKGKKSSKALNVTKKKNSSADIEMDAIISQPNKVKKRNKKKNGHACSDDNAISKFEEVNKTAKVCKVNAVKEPESEFSCEKIGINTFLVQAEIHPPPPSSLNMPKMIEDSNKENEKLNLQHMQVTVVLDDILKSKNVELLNINDKNLLCGKAVSFKSPISASTSFRAIDPEESIEKFRCDPAHSVDDCDLVTDKVIDISHDDLAVSSIGNFYSSFLS